jgi:hypothetical protein
VNWEWEWLRWWKPWIKGIINEQSPNISKADATDEIVDIDAPVAKGAALFIGFGDRRFKGDDAF